MKVAKLQDQRTILLADNGAPVLVTLAMRAATTAPARMKCALVVEADGHALPLPFAQAIVGVGKRSNGADKTPNGWTPEFRMELN